MERLSDLTARMERMELRGEFVRYCQLLAKHAGNVDFASDEAYSSGLSRAVRAFKKSAVAAGSTGSDAWAQDLVDFRVFSGEWMSLLASRTVRGQIPFRRAAFNTGTLLEATPGGATWVAEGFAIPMARMGLDRKELERTKIAGFFLLTKESVRVASPAALTNINNAMLRVVGRYEDQAFLNPDIAAVAAKNPASLTNGARQVSSTGNAEAQITANLKSLLQVHVDAGSDLTDVWICMHPATALHMSQLLTAGNIRAFPNLGVRGGEIFGLPVLTTVGAVCSGSPTEKVIAAVNAQGVIVADDGDIEIQATDKGTIQMDDAPTQDAIAGTASNVVSLWQTETVALRFTRWLNFERTHTDAVSFMRVTY